jgi:hypothetical protein
MNQYLEPVLPKFNYLISCVRIHLMNIGHLRGQWIRLAKLHTCQTYISPKYESLRMRSSTWGKPGDGACVLYPPRTNWWQSMGFENG